jgi:predicted nucleotidyltransferase
MYGLKNTDIGKLQAVFAKYAKVRKVIIYGSRAMGNNRPNSDIDFVLVGENLELEEQFAIENDLDDLLLPYKIDVAIFHKIKNEDLIDHINRRGITFFTNDNY